MAEREYKAVIVRPGTGGWGKQLVIRPTDRRTKIVSVTGGGIHPVAARIAELTGGEPVDGFRNAVPSEEIACVVIDCGGTARIGVYPRMGVPTIDVMPSSPSGPLAQYITEDNFVSGVTPAEVLPTDAAPTPSEGAAQRAAAPAVSAAATGDAFAQARALAAERGVAQKPNWIVRVGQFIGYVVATLYQSGREAVDMMLRNILPFMAFVSMLIGLILYTGLGNALAKVVAPLGGTVWGLLLIVLIGTFPVLSPMLGPGAVIAQIVGVFVGTEIAAGVIPPSYALPALFAIDGQVGCDFVPVALALGEAAPETVEVGVPSVLFSRQITGVIAVFIAYFASFGMYPAGAK